jgi:phosphohistidine swiveling domain-containing protein
MATRMLRDGEPVTVDAVHGVVREGVFTVPTAHDDAGDG